MTEPSRGLLRRSGIALGVGAAVAGVAGAAYGLSRRASRLARVAGPTDGGERLVAPFDEEWTLPSTGGASLRVISRGTGRPLVLVHGVTLTADIWVHQLESLPDLGYRVVAFDQRGHGASPAGEGDLTLDALADDLDMVLRTLDLHDVLLVGHSMGGMVALRHVTAHRAEAARRLRGLVLVSTTARTIPFVPSPLRTVLRGAARRGPVVTAPLALPSVGRAIARTGFGRGARTSHVEHARRLITETDPATVRATTGWLVEVDLSAALEDVTLPTLVVSGSADVLTSVNESRALARHIPHARLVVLEGAGHTLMLERASDFDALVREFDADLEATAARPVDVIAGELASVTVDVPLRPAGEGGR